ncbi:MAG: cytochrome c biogenesis protein CcsA [Isosphaeraceae bacterium]|nr:cytochrome c biogenesis protein CcsA [Isosphaeraceae bacterium]
MRRFPRIGLAFGLALGLAALGGSAAVAAEPGAKPAPESLGKGPAYSEIALLPVLHEGRVKPLDTLAREELKQIHGRETIKLADDDGETVASWTAAAAFVDMLARPEFWDEQRFITVEYLPLKSMVLTDQIQTELAALVGSLPEAARPAFEPILKAETLTEAAIRDVLRSVQLDKPQALAVERLSKRLGEGMKWLAPEEIEHAQVTVEGRKIPFTVWLDSISRKKEEASEMQKPKLPEIERRAYDLGVAFARWRNLRDSAKGLQSPWRLIPRPSSQAYVLYSGEAMKKAQTEGPRSLSQFELEVAVILNKHLEQIQRSQWKTPGADADFDANYRSWLANDSAWMPIGAILTTPTDTLAKAGFDASKADAFKSAYQKFLEAERAEPGKLADAAPAQALVASVRELTASAGASNYPTVAAMSREVRFNAFGPFFWAPWVYLAGTVLLVLSLAVPLSRNAVLVGLRRGLYLLGMTAFVGGIGLEIFGFSQRVLISGWAPVTNMYETVIWVGLVTAVIGLVLELMHRRAFAAIAASGIAMVCTMLAATVPLLDPKIAGLQPVLRSNLWLTIHVLTIVSSYAAFALALGLGLIALVYYLTAIYRREASLGRLLVGVVAALVLLPLPMYLVRTTDAGAPFGSWTLTAWYCGSALVLCVAGLAVANATALFGEVVSRARFRRLQAITVRDYRPMSGGAPDATAEMEPTAAESDHQTASTPVGTAPVALDEARLRESAMRETAEKIKSLSNYIYRSMQVGVLLVAAGTILGGVWADYSWGRFWGWDPKEVWALITLLVYLIPLHGRFAGWVNTFGLVWSSVVCFLSVLMAWYGVNFILGVGLHSYGFVEGGSQGSVLVATAAVLAFASGVWIRRAACTPKPTA